MRNVTIFDRDTDLDASDHPTCDCEQEACPLLADGIRNGHPLSSEHAVTEYGKRLTAAEIFALQRRLATYGL